MYINADISTLALVWFHSETILYHNHGILYNLLTKPTYDGR